MSWPKIVLYADNSPESEILIKLIRDNGHEVEVINIGKPGHIAVIGDGMIWGFPAIHKELCLMLGKY